MRVLFKDPVLRWLAPAVFAYAWFFSQGVPLWDDDFTSMLRKIKDGPLARYVWDWVNPIVAQPEAWGFHDRPIQRVIYKVFHSVSGYEAWSYFLFKNLVYAGLAVIAYRWALRLVPGGEASRGGRLAAAAGSPSFCSSS